MAMDEMYTPSGFTRWDENGPHQYGPQRTWLGSTKQGLTPERAFELLRYYAAPGQLYPAMNSGDTSDAWLIIKGIPVRNLGKVEHHIFPEALTIVNTTLKGHALDPGNVFRRIVQDGDNI